MNHYIIMLLLYLSLFGTCSGDFEFINQAEILDSYSLYRPIEEGGEEYLFEFLFLDRTNKKQDNLDFFTNSLKVVVKNKHNQIIDTVITNVDHFFPESYHITDFNFDGYNDILVLESRAGARANHGYCGFIWNKKQQKFISVEIPNPNLVIDRKSQRLLTVCANGASAHTYAIYKIKNDKITLESTLIAGYLKRSKFKEYNIDEKTDKIYWHYLECEFDDNGNKKIVNDIVSYSGDENTARIKELYYSENSKWDLGGLKFYQSDYGSGLGIYNKETNEPIDVHLDLGYHIDAEMNALYQKMLSINQTGKLCNRFALCDFDNNAVPEIILEGTHGTRRILTYHKGKIIMSDAFKYRAMKTIKTDGTFDFSGGAPYYGIAKLVFENGKAKYNILCYNDLDDNAKKVYYLEDGVISEAAFNELIEKQGYKDDITWYDYSIENLEKVLLQ